MNTKSLPSFRAMRAFLLVVMLSMLGITRAMAAYSTPVTDFAGSTTYLTSLSDNFNDGVIDPELWIATGNNVYEEEGLLKMDQNITDQNVSLLSVPMSVSSDNKIVVERRFFLHKSYEYYYGGFSFEFNGDTGVHGFQMRVGAFDNTIPNDSGVDHIGIVYCHTDWESKYGVYVQAGVGSEIQGTRICDAIFDTWIDEKVELDLTAGTLSYYLDGAFIATVDIPELSALQVNYFTTIYWPWGYWTGHQHYMDYVNINASLDAAYTVAVTANPTEGGEVSGGGTYAEGAECTLTATANAGYTFSNWTENGEVVSTEAAYTFTVTGDRDLVANFEMEDYIVFADPNVKAICVANWDTNGSGELSYAEAAAVTDLGQVFRGNTEITSFEELQYFTGLTRISDYEFYLCSGLTGNLIIPNSVTIIGVGAFYHCSGFTGNLTIPNSVVTIGSGAFNGCSGFDGELTINNSVSSIESFTFYECSGLTGSLTIPNSITSIGESAFNGCSGLTGSLTISNSMTTIGNYAFYDCSGLTSMSVLAETPPALGSQVFGFVPKDIPVYVPCNSLEAYQDAEGWNEFTNYQGVDCQSVITVTTSLSDDFNDGVIDPELWIATGNNVYEEEGLLKMDQNITDQNVSLLSVPMSVSSDNKIVVERRFFLHKSYEYYYGGFSFEFNGDTGVHGFQMRVGAFDNTIPNDSGVDHISIVYCHTDWESKYGIYVQAGVGSEIQGTRICDAVFDTWIDEKVELDLTAGTLSYYLDGAFIATVDIPELAALQVNYFTTIYWPWGYWTGHQHYMDYVNINASLDAAYTIAVTANPTEGGEVSGGGTYAEGAECTLTATANAGYTFSNWTENGEVVSTETAYTFTVMGDRDLVANFAESIQTQTQTVALSSGWNWMSSYLESSDELFSDLKSGIAAANNTAIIKNMGGNTMLQGGSWSGSLDFNNESMYMMNVGNATEVTLTAPPAKTAMHPITLGAGWNWIGFPSIEAMEVNKALSGLTPNNGDVIKNMGGVSSYTGSAWQGSLSTLEPGKGYMYYNKGTEPMTLVYPGTVPIVQGVVEIPESMDASNIIVTNFSEEVVPDENGEFEIGYGDLLIAYNVENDKPVYFNLISLESNGQRRGTTLTDVEMSVKETTLYLALRVLPNGTGDMSDDWLNVLKTILYPLDCVQQLEQAVQQSLDQYGYLNEDAINNHIEAVRAYFYETLIYPIIENYGNTRAGLTPPAAEQDHFGQVAKIDIRACGYDSANDVWQILTTCWNGMGVCVGVADVGEILPNQLSENLLRRRPTAIIPPTLLVNMFSAQEVLSYQHFVDLFNDVGNLLHGNTNTFSTTGVSRIDVEFYLDRNENAIAFMGPENKYVEVCNFITLGIESVKFILGKLVKETNPQWLDALLIYDDFELDLIYADLIRRWNETHDPQFAKNIVKETIRKLGTYWLDNGVLPWDKMETYNKYVEMISSFAFGLDLFTAYVEYSLYHPFFFPVGGEHEGPMVGDIGFDGVTSSSANVYAVVTNEGAHPVVERGWEWGYKDPSGKTLGGDVVAEGGGAGIFTYHFEDLYPNTYYFGAAWARQELGGEKFYANKLFEFRTMSVFEVNVSVEPEEGGAVSGAGTFDQFDECTLTATPAAGYIFSHWTEEGETVSTNATYSFTVTSSRNLVANFVLDGGGSTVDDNTIGGVLPGVFTVNANGGKVNFSQGNLQYIGSAGDNLENNEGAYWKFADNQWDFIGGNGNGSGKRSDRDLFGWGTSGFNHGANCYQPWSYSTNNSDYYAYGANNNNLYDQTGQADWGYNAISNGGNLEGLWRTLTQPEWDYVFNTRGTNTGIRYAKADVNNVNGVILLPDDWSANYYFLSNTNQPDSDYASNTITASQWVTLEQHGAVFLPAAGYQGRARGVGDLGHYHSASCGDNDYSWYIWFGGSALHTDCAYSRYYCQSVRLVRASQGAPLAIKASPNPAWGGTVSGKGAYAEGAVCTLMATPAAGYAFSHWTEGGVTVSTEATYSFTVTCNRTLVANFVLAGEQSSGALNGVFTVNANGNQVNFSQGNLQYIGSAGNGDENNTGAYWKFADHQWDCLGGYEQVMVNQRLDRDLFGWGTSGYHDANDPYNVNYQPWSTSSSTVNESYNYYGYGPSINMASPDLTGSSANYDWGVYNPIINGGNQAGFWRTPTHEEWSYLFNTRSTNSGIRYAKAQVNNVNGVILLPDDWSTEFFTLNNTNQSNAGFSSNTISASQWSTLEQHGAVFLPAAGLSYGYSNNYIGAYGVYWSAASYDDGSWGAGSVSFNDWGLYTDYGEYRYCDLSVRLVRSTQSANSFVINASLDPVEGGTVSGAGIFEVGAVCALIATPAGGYAFSHWTEDGVTVCSEVSYSFVVTSNRNLVANFVLAGEESTGVLNGIFTVNANGDQVYFSQGNLQYQASTNTWRFAENQYDYVGSVNANISETYDGWIDLFDWGTSGYNHGANCYQPWSTSTSYSDYYAYGQYTYNLYDQTGQADWGYNAISNGGNSTGLWRTLTQAEWNYLFNTRSTASGIRYAKASVNNVNGVILLPDDWSAGTYSLSNTNEIGASYSTNSLSGEQWSVLEQAGAVFLPAAGIRSGTSILAVGSDGYYWSASYRSSNTAWSVEFCDSYLDADAYDLRYWGPSVRLVRSAQ